MVKPNGAAISKGSEAEAEGRATALDKSFGFLKFFGTMYELGDERSEACN